MGFCPVIIILEQNKFINITHSHKPSSFAPYAKKQNKRMAKNARGNYYIHQKGKPTIVGIWEEIMNRKITVIVVALACACCLGLAACGNNSAASSSAASSSAATSSAAKSTSASTSSSASSSAVTAADVTPEFKEYADRYIAVCDDVIAVAEKGQAAGSYDAVKDEWEAVSDKLGAFTDEQLVWAQKYNDGTLSEADRAYYDQVLVPKATKAVKAASSMLDLVKKQQ